MKKITDIYAPRQLEVLERVWTDDFFICGLHGAKRSGKTVVNNDIFISEVNRVKRIADEIGVDEPMYILAGTSATSVQNNILQELYNKYGFEPKFDKHGSFTMSGVKIVQVYTGSIGGLKRARGFTAFGAYVNEASLANESVFKEIVSRCSGKGARIVWDSNPDHPNHWLKRDYIDSSDPMIIDFRFKLDDNTFLDERYRESIKAATPSGTFYDRDILGLWTVGEGAIYSDFDENKHVVDELPEMEEYFVGVDWGYEHFGAMVVIGYRDGIYYVVEEHARQHQHIDFWVDVAYDIRKKYGLNIPFYCDSARPEYVDALFYAGANAINAYKAVIAGITEVGKYIKTDRLKVHRSCKKFQDEIHQYVWNKNGDKPEDINDDVMDAVRYAIYSQRMIETEGALYEDVE